MIKRDVVEDKELINWLARNTDRSLLAGLVGTIRAKRGADSD